MKLSIVFTFLFCSLVGRALGIDVILKEGDCWSYDTRVGEEDSFIVIRKIETVPQLGEVVHISIFGINVKTGFPPSGFTPSILLQPFSGGPLRASLKQQITREIPPGEWEFAYQSLSEKRHGHQAIPVLVPIKEHLASMEKTVRPASAPVEVGGGLAMTHQVTRLSPMEARRVHFNLTMAKVRAGDPAGRQDLDAILWEFKSRPFGRTPLETLELLGFHFLPKEGVEKTLPRIVTATAIGWYDASRFASAKRRDELANVESFFTKVFLVASESVKRDVKAFFRENPARAKQLIAQGFTAAEALRHDARLDHRWLEPAEGEPTRLGAGYELPRQQWAGAWEETKKAVVRELETWAGL
jgi:hypothetical protein